MAGAPVRAHVCSSGKAAARSRRELVRIAAFLARKINEGGELAPDLYGYRCPSCGCWHLTKLVAFEGKTNLLVRVAAPERLQVWAMTGALPGVS